MTALALYVILVAATYRVLRVVQTDTVTERGREWVFDRLPPTLDRARVRSVWDAERRTVALTLRTTDRPAPRVSSIGRGLSCPWCLGFWLSGVAVFVVARWYASLPLPLLWWWAVATGVGLVAKAGE